MQNNDKKVLLKITNLKQYFPLKKEFLSKEQLYVKANDGISLDIFEGETLGLVGESGCGKSTFGRVLLQLYHQTDGKTMYFGRTIDTIAPKYQKVILEHVDSKLKALDSANQKRDEFIAVYDKLSEEEKPSKKNEKDALTNRSLNLFLDLAQIFGGFLALDDIKPARDLMLKRYHVAVSRNEATAKKAAIIVQINKAQGVFDDKKADNKTASDSKIVALKAKVDALDKVIDEKQAEFDGLTKEIEKLKEAHRDNAKFNEYEAYQNDGIDLAKLTYKEMRTLRKDLQLIFQDPYSSLNPRMTVGQIISEGLMAHRFYDKSDNHMQDYVMKVMEDCGLSSYMIHRYPHQFSGGQRQRIGIARSLALKPKFVVCDEAVSALDVSIQSQVINLLQDLKEQENLTYLFISHDLSVVKYISDRIGVMYLGNIVELANSEEIFEHPLHPYTEALLLAIPTTDVENKKAIVPLEGDIPSPIKPPKGCKFHTRCKYCTDICKEATPDFVEARPGHFVACHHILDHKVI